jgi:RND family efflux transporter MFP subunit
METNMAAKFKKIAVPAVILVAAFAVAAGLSAMRKPPEKKSETKPALLVEVQQIQPQDLVYQIESQGSVIPKMETSLVSEVNGLVVSVADSFVEGGFFQKGDLLVRLEQSDYLTAVKAAEAGLATAVSALEEEKARVRVAEEDWRSFQAGKAPALGLRRPQLASALAKVRSAEADVERAKRDLSRTEIRAPYAGMVKGRNVDLGQFVSRGSSIGTIYGTDIAEVRLPLTDHDVAYLDFINAATPSQVLLTAQVAGKTHSWQAELVRTEGILDERSRVIHAVAEVKNPYQLGVSGAEPLRFGRFVKASITGRQARQVVVVPRHLLRPAEQLLVVDNTQQLQFRTVVLDRADEKQAYISAGFEQGDQILVSPVTNPLPGLKVRLNSDVKPETPVKTAEAVAANGGQE